MGYEAKGISARSSGIVGAERNGFPLCGKDNFDDLRGSNDGWKGKKNRRNGTYDPLFSRYQKGLTCGVEAEAAAAAGPAE